MNSKLQIAVLLTLFIFGLALFVSGHNLRKAHYQKANLNFEPPIAVETTNFTEPESPLTSNLEINGDLYLFNQIIKDQTGYKINLDAVEWLSASEGTCTNLDDSTGNIPQCNPNGFLIQNEIEEFKTLPVSDSVTVLTTNNGTNPAANSILQISEFYNKKDQYKQRPFIVQIEKGTVTGLKEAYTP
jgi:hypothetical protein